MHDSRMDNDGRVTIPRELRERLGLKPGDVVLFAPGPGRTLLIHPHTRMMRMLDAVRRNAVTQEEMNVLLSGERPEPSRPGATH